jgi:hypothetical protein
MAIVLDGTSGITTPALDSAGTITAPDVDSSLNGLPYPDASSIGFRNRIINGDMRIDQRNNGASVSTSGAYAVDRFQIYGSQAGKFTAQRNAGGITPPFGFSNYLGITSTSAYSLLSTDQFLVWQKVEGFNFSDMAWGTASAATATLSFRVYSSLTGTFGGYLQNAAQNRSYPFTFAISAANTWTTISVTIPGDTSGTWVVDNGIGVLVGFNLGTGATYSAAAGAWTGTSFVSAPTGAVSLVGTSGATFYITGVQLEAGSVATPFERRDYGRELIMCLRYGWRIADGTAARVASGTWNSSTSADVLIQLPVQMRATPTLTVIANGALLDFAVAWYAVTSLTLFESSNKAVSLSVGVASSSAVQGKGAAWGAAAGANPNAFLGAEL